MNAPIYLDYNATTPLAPEVAAAMRPWIEEQFGNPSSAHVYGRRAREAVARARASVAALIGAQADEIVFAGSATEANNLALLGAARAAPAGRRHLIVSAIEHPAVMQPALHLRDEGWRPTVLGVDETGRVAPDDLRAALRPDTALVSVMHANNEVGTLQPVDEIAAPVGSACHPDADTVSGVLAAMRFSSVRARGAVRLSVGFPTTAADVETAAALLASAWRAAAR